MTTGFFPPILQIWGGVNGGGGDQILFLTVGHQNNLDFIVLNEFLVSKYPDHHPVLVMSEKSLVLFPFVRDFIHRLHIIVGKDKIPSVQDLVEHYIQLGYPRRKLIVVLFPEGGLYTQENVRKSDAHCKKQSVPPFRNVLMPREKAFHQIRKSLDALLERFPGTSARVEGLVLHFPELDKTWYAFTAWYDILFPPYAVSMVDWVVFDASDMDSITTIFRRMDDILESSRCRRKGRKEPLLWVTSKLLYLLIPFVMVYHGFWMGVLPSMLLFTSYQWHYHRKWLHIDRLMAVVNWIVFFFTYRESQSRFMMILGVMCHVLLERYSRHQHSRDLGHVCLHALCYLSFFAEHNVMTDVMTAYRYPPKGVYCG